MSGKKKLIALLHASRTCMGLFVVFTVLFCIFPTQMWMIPIMVGGLVGFAVLRIIHSVKKKDWDKDE